MTASITSSWEGSLSHEAREAFLFALVLEGRAEWLKKGHRKWLSSGTESRTGQTLFYVFLRIKLPSLPGNPPK
ncbi:hypothetical protein Nepgr_028879 [Nepenthes gracilis]|uniref:Uncharacterized protein n=1 Tax=Nepenthes gracilis TaxID=150966 RepID=A0AAD3TDU8_NEPGR|nr:hypothetical protein Nepgr_028879 [Nepenthes gracilis]